MKNTKKVEAWVEVVSRRNCWSRQESTMERVEVLGERKYTYSPGESWSCLVRFPDGKIEVVGWHQIFFDIQ